MSMNRKVYVRVLAETDENGNIEPVSVTWEDGKTYFIDAVTDIRRSYAKKVGGTAMRYTVKIKGKQTYIFLDDGKWFVESRA